MSSNSLNWYFCMNSLLPETKMNSRVILSFIYSAASIKASGWGKFMLQYHFKDLDDRMSKLEKGLNVTKTAEETDVELYREMSMDANLIGKFINQQVAAAMAEKTKQ